MTVTNCFTFITVSQWYRLNPCLLVIKNKSAFSVVNSAVKTTLPVFAAVRRSAAPLLLSTGACHRSISPGGDQEQNRRMPLLLSNDGTDRRTDGRTDRRTLDRFIDLALFGLTIDIE